MLLNHFHEKKFLMVFADSFHPKFKSDLKKIDKSVAKEIRNKHLDIILKNPCAYKVLENDEVVFYYMVASRENFYKKLTQRVE